MYTKEDLEQLRTLPGEIKLLEERCRELEYNLKRYQTMDAVRGCIPEYPYTEHSITIRGIGDIEGYTQEREMLEAYRTCLRERRKQRQRMEQYILSIQDSEVRTAMRAYYLQGKTWQQTAFAIGATDEGTARKKIKKFFECSENSDFSEYNRK